MNLSEHFTFEELTFSSTAIRLSIDNTPSAEIVENLRVLASGLEHVRSILRSAVHIDSGFRCPELNTVVNGAVNSAHLSGFAADFVCPGFGTRHRQ
jgi:zinc D-Ala-D-Ala carboxypeptidase